MNVAETVADGAREAVTTTIDGTQKAFTTTIESVEHLPNKTKGQIRNGMWILQWGVTKALTAGGKRRYSTGVDPPAERQSHEAMGSEDKEECLCEKGLPVHMSSLSSILLFKSSTLKSPTLLLPGT